MYNCIILRYGEIGLKSKRSRPWFEKRYLYSIKEALDKARIKLIQIKNYGARFVLFVDNVESASKVLQKVAGVQSISPAVNIPFEDKESLLKKIKKYGSLVKNKKFAAKVRRVGTHSFNSQELAKEIGDNLYEFSEGVDLTNPEVTIEVEVRNNDAYLYTEKIDCVGGLPVDSSQKVLCLFSGGMDSPVAAYQLMKRGCAVDFLFINLEGEKSLYEATRVYNYLTEEYWFGHKAKFYHVDAKEIVKKLVKEVPDRLKQIVLKVIFYKIAEGVGKDYFAIATGESLSQKSSQTLPSLAVIDKFVDKLVMRPVLGMDKIEVIKIAGDIGTYATSQKVTEYCGLAKGAVTTSPNYEEIKEQDIFDEEISKAVENVEITKGVVEVDNPEKVDFSVEDAEVVDIRDEYVKEGSPLEADLSYNYPEVLDRLGEFGVDKKYVIVCTFGVKSDEVAFALLKKGVKALSMTTAIFRKYLKKEE